ncbi:MAG: nuclear transport factor 2 family protein [Verrucomicrobiales bacterium]|nr:nuclear transport factor 2 family protein [Verrucomicrobiales bacterium]
MKQVSKSLHLPNPIATYFAAESGDGEAVSQCFTEDAIVKDEGRIYNGRNAIRKWKVDASTRYQYTSEPFASEARDGKTVVTSHVAGNFPGSPVDLQFCFELEGDKIASLEIR